jgi:tetratricopeptide (TPR) repeat protein
MQKEFFRRPVFHLVLIALMGLFVYSNTFDVPFQFDDTEFVADNPIIKDIGYYISPSKANSLKYWGNTDILRFLKTRPVSYLSLWANHRLGGLDVTGYHVVNTTVHVINALLVYLIVMLTFRTSFLKGSAIGKRSGFIALFSGLLFAVHPLQTEAVIYILQRCVVLDSMFCLLSMVFYIKFRLRTSNPSLEGEGLSSSSLLLYFAALLSCVLAMKTKESAFTLPVAIALYEFMFFNATFKKRVLFLAPLLFTMLIIPLEYISLSSDAELATALDSASRSKGAPPRIDYLFTQFRAIAGYIGLILFPVGQTVDHDQQVYNSFLEPQVFLSFLFLLGIFGFSIYLFYRSRFTDYSLRLCTFGIFWFFLALSVESSVFPIGEMMVEYRVYPSSAGVHIALASGIFLLISRIRNKAPAFASLVLIIIVLSSATYARSYVWEDNFTLWKDAVEKSPNKARPHNNLGVAYMANGRMEEAIEHYKAALKSDPSFAESHFNLGSVSQAKGMTEEAIEYYKAALKCDPGFTEIYPFLGKAYMEKGVTEEAEEQFRVALRLNPNNAKLYFDIGSAYLESEYADKAVEYFKAALGLNPDDALTHSNLGVAYQYKGMLDKAVEHYRLAAELEPRNPTSYYNLGNVYQSRGLLDNAVQLYQIALKLDPDYAEVHSNLGVAYQSKGMFDKAIEHYRAALELKPYYAEAHFNLGLVYFQQGLMEKAREEFEGALRIDPGYSKARESLDNLTEKQQM